MVPRPATNMGLNARGRAEVAMCTVYGEFVGEAVSSMRYRW